MRDIKEMIIQIENIGYGEVLALTDMGNIWVRKQDIDSHKYVWSKIEIPKELKHQ